MDPDAREDPLRTLTVDRVVRADGRYLLYYAWPEEPPEPQDLADASTGGGPSESGPPDV